MIYRPANYSDRMHIAALHADSWRSHYRGAYRDDFLDGPVFDERREVWQKRLASPPSNQFVVLAEDGDELVGFAYVYGGDDEMWGTLLDNIHVRLSASALGSAGISCLTWLHGASPTMQIVGSTCGS